MLKVSSLISEGLSINVDFEICDVYHRQVVSANYVRMCIRQFTRVGED